MHLWQQLRPARGRRPLTEEAKQYRLGRYPDLPAHRQSGRISARACSGIGTIVRLGADCLCPSPPPGTPDGCAAPVRVRTRLGWKRASKVEWIWRRSAGLVPGRWSASSLHSARKRSRRALEWSGPCPSYPCGSATTRPDCWPHRSSPAHDHGTASVLGLPRDACTRLRIGHTLVMSRTPRRERTQ